MTFRNKGILKILVLTFMFGVADLIVSQSWSSRIPETQTKTVYSTLNSQIQSNVKEPQACGDNY